MSLEVISDWLGTAPRKVIMVIVLTLGIGLTGWLWTVEAEISNIENTISARGEKIAALEHIGAIAAARLDRMEDKIDKLLVQSAELSIEIRRSRYQTRYPTVNFDMPPEPKPPATTKFLQPLTNRENK